MKAIVVGGGLAGCEAAHQLSRHGISVDLYEMKPGKKTPAHSSNWLGELVCSNSLRADTLENGAGLLKAEMRLQHSVIMAAADATRVPAGGALAVDREGFARAVTAAIREDANITVMEQEVTQIPEGDCVVIASGPLTSQPLAEDIARFVGQQSLYFYDAAAPIVTAESIDLQTVYRKARYDRGTPDYLNCPMNKEQYLAFYHALITAETAELKAFEKQTVFEGCMPIEVMASRGEDTMRFGPLKPVGLADPRTGKEPYAVVQLRQDDRDGRLYNIVGFQTHLKFGEQKRVFAMIPGLEQLDIVRYGVMHRNTFINSPAVLDGCYMAKCRPGLFFAGQMTGVEGYVESASSGIVAGMNAARYLLRQPPLRFPTTTATGALANHISTAPAKQFQPMNINFGLIDSLPQRIRDKRERYRKVSERGIREMQKIMGEQSE